MSASSAVGDGPGDGQGNVAPNLSVNTDAPRARLHPRGGAPVTLVRSSFAGDSARVR